MKKLLASSLIPMLLCLALAPLALADLGSPVPDVSVSSHNHEAHYVSDSKEQTVYVTKTGAKYHRGTCRYLKKSKIAMNLSEARKSYSPCKVCKPPE